MNLLASLYEPSVWHSPSVTASRLLLLVVLISFGLWLVLRYLQLQAARRSEAWQRLATELDFAYKPAGGPVFRHKSEEVEGVLDGVTVRLARYGLSPGFDSAVYTRWSAEPDPKPDFVLYLHRKHAVSRLANLMGYEDVPTGDPEFDRRYSAKSDNAEKLRQMLAPEVRKKIEALSTAAIVVNETGVNVVWPGPIHDAGELKTGLEALRALIKAMPPATSKKAASGQAPAADRGGTAGPDEVRPSEAGPGPSEPGSGPARQPGPAGPEAGGPRGDAS